MLERIVVFTLLALAAAFPEMCDGKQLLVPHLVFQIEDELEMSDSGVRFFFRHRDHAFGHTEMNVIRQRETGTGPLRKMRQQALDEFRIAKSDIDPLCKIAQEGGGVWRRWLEPLDQVPGLRQPRHAAVNAAEFDVLLELIEKPG